MIRLKINSHFNKIVLIFLVLSVIYSLYVIVTNSYNSKYDLNTNQISGYINELIYDGNKINIELIGKEKIIVNYYVKTYDELIEIKSDYQLGDIIEIKGEIVKPSINTVFNLFNYQKYLLSKKIYWLFNADDIKLIAKNKNINYKIKNIIINHIESFKQNKKYLYTFILGSSHYLDDNIMTSYRDNGITHLFAISGMQIMLLAMFILKIGKHLISNEKVILIIVIIFLFFYAFLVNFSPSIMRAIILYIVLTVNRVYSLKISQKYLFLLVFSLFLLYNPYFVYNLGFLFSFIICFYFLLFKDYLEYFHNYFLKLLITSLIAFLVSLPIMIDNFYEINLLTPLVNLLFIPLVTFILFPLSIITMLLPITNFLLKIFLSIFENISLALSNISIFHLIMAKPSLFIILIYYLLITIILYDMKHHQYRFVFILVTFAIIHHNINCFYHYPSITFIDVGQGDSTLIVLPHNQGNILIDTGGIMNYNKEDWQQRKNPYQIANDTIIPYLKSLGIKKLDYLILTHGDYDHIGEANNLITNYPVKKVIFNSGDNNVLETSTIKVLDTKKIPYLFLNKKQIGINNYKLNFLNSKNIKDENKDSLIILAKLNKWHILLMGDASKEEEKTLINTYLFEKVDILKVGHHGSNTSSDELFIKNLKPNIGIISAGRNNRYHHPHPSTLDTLNKYQILTYVTSISGSIKFVLKDKLTIYTCL